MRYLRWKYKGYIGSMKQKRTKTLQMSKKCKFGSNIIPSKLIKEQESKAIPTDSNNKKKNNRKDILAILTLK